MLIWVFWLPVRLRRIEAASNVAGVCASAWHARPEAIATTATHRLIFRCPVLFPRITIRTSSLKYARSTDAGATILAVRTQAPVKSGLTKFAWKRLRLAELVETPFPREVRRQVPIHVRISLEHFL